MTHKVKQHRTRKQIHEFFTAYLERTRVELGLSMTEMAAALDVPVATYKNIVYGKVGMIDISIACKLYELTGAWMYEMTGYGDTQAPVVNLYTALEDDNKRLIEDIYWCILKHQDG